MKNHTAGEGKWSKPKSARVKPRKIQPWKIGKQVEQGYANFLRRHGMSDKAACGVSWNVEELLNEC